jgi:hypothetical protein
MAAGASLHAQKIRAGAPRGLKGNRIDREMVATR